MSTKEPAAMADFDSRLERYLKNVPAAARNPLRATRLLFHAAHRLETKLDGALAPYGLVMREYLALAVVDARRDEAMRPSELSLSLDATRTQITRLLDGLEKRGLLRRKLSAEDRRGLDVTLTAAGTRLLAEAAPAVHQAYRGCWADFDADALDATVDGLRQLNRALGEEEA